MGRYYADEGATCTDPEDGDLDATVVSNTVNTHSTGSYRIIYSCTDSAGHTVNVSRTVNVLVYPPPAVTLDRDTAVLEVTFGATADATPSTQIDPTKFHVREAGTAAAAAAAAAAGVTLSPAELDTDTDSATVTFTLTQASLAAVNALNSPELTIDPAAVRYTSGIAFGATFDVSTANFTDSFPVRNQDTVPRDLALSPDGTRMFVLGGANNTVNGYALPAPFDLTGASFTGSFPVGDQDDAPRGLTLSPDGTRMFVAGDDGNDVNGYALPAPFDLTGASFTGSFPVGDQDDAPRGLALSPDGTRMFVLGGANNTVNGYALPAPFDLTGASFTGSFPVGDQDRHPRGLALSSDGTRMFVVGNDGNDVNEYALPAPFDLTGASFTDSFPVGDQDDAPVGLAFSPDGTRMFVAGANRNEVHEYALSSAFAIALTGTSPPSPDAFVTTWTTDGPGQNVTIPASGTYDIDWGDDMTGIGVTGSQTHTYAAAGNHTVSITGGGLERIRLTPPQYDEQKADNARRLVSVDQWGNATWTAMERAFAGATNMQYRATDAPDLSGVGSTSRMFERASAFDGNVSGWDTSGVTDMSYMFSSARMFNGNVSGWDTSGVTDMRSMFRAAAAFNGDLGAWNTSGVTDMGSMFRDASSFNGNVSGWNTSGVTDMHRMFRDASSFNGTVSGWDTSGATDMGSMFSGAAAFNGDLGSRWKCVFLGSPNLAAFLMITRRSPLLDSGC